ncbi:hypothetical protein [Bacteroides sp.]
MQPDRGTTEYPQHNIIESHHRQIGQHKEETALEVEPPRTQHFQRVEKQHNDEQVAPDEDKGSKEVGMQIARPQQEPHHPASVCHPPRQHDRCQQTPGTASVRTKKE